MDHKKLAAQINLVLGAIGVVFSVIAFIMALYFMIAPNPSGPAEESAYFALFLVILSLPALLLSLASVWASRQYLKNQEDQTARVALIVISVINLFFFPLGTVLGAYTLFAFLQKT